MKTSKKLRRRRTELGLTQAQVAQKASMSVVQYNGYENARHEPTETTMARLARALKCSPDLLWDDAHAEPEQSSAELKEALRKQAAKELNISPSRIRVRVEVV